MRGGRGINRSNVYNFRQTPKARLFPFGTVKPNGGRDWGFVGGHHAPPKEMRSAGITRMANDAYTRDDFGRFSKVA